MNEDKVLNNETAITQATGSDAVAEAQALTEMSNKVRTLEAQNAELMAAKKKYYDNLLNGNSAEEVAPDRTVKDIRNDLWHSGKELDSMSNREYASLVLELDNACIKETGESCFLPKGKNINATADERDVAERMHDALDYCVSNSSNDFEFNQL